MTLRVYADENVHGRIIHGLRLKGFDVLTVAEDKHDGFPDPEIVHRATELDRVVFTHDQDYLAIGAHLQRARQPFSGIVYGHPDALSVTEFVEQLELALHCYASDEVRNQIIYLPLG
jgi:hypothetical protein